MTRVSSAQMPNGTIKIDMDDQKCAGGRAITYSVFQQLVHNYCAQKDLNTNERIAYVIDKQLLHILLSSKECTGLMLCKCMRPSETKSAGPIYSIAFVAVDKDGNPVHAKRVQKGGKTTTIQADKANDVPAGEWIQGITVGDAIDRGIITEVMDRDKENGFNMDLFLDSWQEAGHGLL
jgi:hypothetical protein